MASAVLSTLSNPKKTNFWCMQANMDSLEEAELDPLQFRPNPEALVPKTTGNEAAGAEAGGLYKPPMLNPVAMEADPDKDPDRRKRRAAEEKTRRSARSQMVTDLAREFADAPDEVNHPQDHPFAVTI